MIKIGLLGANGQVGTEVAFHLSLKHDIDILCLIRSEYSAALFKLLAIPYKVVDYSDKKTLSQLLSSFDVVLDFSYTSGEVSDILKWIKKHVESVISGMRAHSKYFYMSSIMAYGVPNPADHLRNYLFPRTVYAYSKRCAESTARKMGNKYQVDIYNFRLGQVHGPLQMVTQLFISKLRTGKLYVNGAPQSLTNTVFTHSISEAISKCIQGNVIPRTYTIVSFPQWTSEELFHFYENRYGFNAEIKYVGAARTGQFYLVSRFDALKKMRSLRDLVETYFLINCPSVAFRIKGCFRRKAAQGEISMMHPEDEIYPMLLGPVPEVPAPTVPNIKSAIPETQKSMDHFETTLFKVIDKAKKKASVTST